MSSELRQRKKGPQGEDSTPDVVEVEKPANQGGLSFLPAFAVLAVVRLFSAAYNNIADCDETFNFWEPTHYVLYGFGFQTWEHSPSYALHSYAFVMPHVAAAKVAQLVAANKVQVFYGVRAALGLFCAAGEARLCTATVRRWGAEAGWILLVLLATSSGMFHASTAYLPSVFCMHLAMYVYAFWIARDPAGAVMTGLVSVIFSSWPYIGAMYVPLALDVVRTQGIIMAVLYGFHGVLGMLLPLVVCDTLFYGDAVLAPWNTVAYNVFGGGRGSQSELYGTEPWWFYLLNCTLNLNVAFACALPSLPLVLHCHRDRGGDGGAAGAFSWSLLWQMLPMYIWLGIMNSQAHKEERFIFPIYPLFCLSAALALAPFASSPTSPAGQRVRFVSRIFGAPLLKAMVGLVLLAGVCMSVSRSYSMYKNYSAPLQAYQQLYDQLENMPGARLAGAETTIVCVGKEWFRYPASFFIPEAPPKMRFGFTRSSFGGQLPAPFQAEKGTSRDGGAFNSQNRMEEDRFTPLEQCSYFVDLELEDQKEEKLSQSKEWEVIVDLPFLDASKSKSLYRAFYIPFLSPKHTTFARYLILRRK